MSKVGVLLIATNLYTEFVPQLLADIKEKFLKNHEVTVFLHTNQPFPATEGLIIVPVEHNPWPHMTLDRYAIFWYNREAYKDMDYLFYIDVDTFMTGDVGEEILNPLTAVISFSYDGKMIDRNQILENNEKSTAFVRPGESFLYCIGGFQGGETPVFLEACRHISCEILKDLRNGVMAKFHDESHWSRYVNNNIERVVKLPPQYAFPEPIIPLYAKHCKFAFIRKDMRKYGESLKGLDPK